MALGLASLTKGPAGFVLPLAVLGTVHLVRREWRELVRLAWVGAGAVAIFLAWSAAYASAAGQGNLVYFIFTQNVKRFLTSWSHQQPWYYYLRNVWMDLMPWSLFLIAAVPRAWKAARRGDRAHALPLLWFAVVFLFFCASSAKRHVYILPLYPAAALMTGALLADLLADEPSRHRRLWCWALLPVACVMVAAGIGGAVGLSRLQSRFPEATGLPFPVFALSGLLILGGVFLAASVVRSRALAAVRALAVSVGAVYLLAMGWILPILDIPLSAKHDAQWLAEQPDAGSGGRLTMFSRAGNIPAEASALAFYGRFAVRAIDSGQEIDAFHAQQPDGLLVLKDSHLDDLVARTPLRPVTVRRLQIGSDYFLAVRLVASAEGTKPSPDGRRGPP